MNSQLYAHIEAYSIEGSEVDDECVRDISYIESVNGDSNIAGRPEPSRIKKCDEEQLSFRIETSAVSFPVGVSLLSSFFFNGDSIAFLFVASISFIWLVCWQQKHSTARDFQQVLLKDSLQIAAPSRHQKEKNVPIRDNFPSQSPLRSNINNETLEDMIFSCRNELSRLLGLIGAIPMREKDDFNDHRNAAGNIDISIRDDNDRTFERNYHDANYDTVHTPVAADAGKYLSTAITAVIDFHEAHVQGILTIDKALYWLKISSSLHWGLGPHSQCVERVERAATSKMTRARHRCTDRRGDDTKNPTMSTTAKTQMNELQNRIDSSSILALSSVRRNIAHVVINLALSIVNTVRTVECAERQRLPIQPNYQNEYPYIEGTNGIKNNPYQADHSVSRNRASELQYDIINDLFEMPDVIDIAWIKESRKNLADLLTYSAERLSTHECLNSFSQLGNDRAEAPQPLSTDVFQILKESAWNARNLRDYLMNHLLLIDDKPSFSSDSWLQSIHPINRHEGADNDYEFIFPLLQYQKQLDALHAALWSFQHYMFTRHASSSAFSLEEDKNPSLQQGDSFHLKKETENLGLRSSSAKLTWWTQVKEISATCQSLEQQIESTFFPPSNNNNSPNIETNDDNSKTYSEALSSNISIEREASCYQHIEGENLPLHEQGSSRSSVATKTLIFSGEGSKKNRLEKKLKRKPIIDENSGTFNINTTGHSTIMPTPFGRDTLAEQLLVRELENRLRSVASLREELQTELLKDDFRETLGEDSSREESTADDSMFYTIDAFRSEQMLVRTPPSVQANKDTGLDRERTTSIFLGASGSLLDELKRNICPDPIIDQETM